MDEQDRLLNAFQRIGQTILSSLNLNEVLDILAEQIIDAGIFSSLTIALVDEKKHTVRVAKNIIRRPDGDIVDRSEPFNAIQHDLADDNITAEVARTGVMQVIDVGNGNLDEVADLSHQEARDEVSYFIPVRRGDQICAVLGTTSPPNRKADVMRRIDMMLPLMDQLAIALEHARRYQEIQDYSCELSETNASLASEVAERKRAEEALDQRAQALQASEANFRNIITASVDGMVIVDRSGVIRFINPAGEVLFGRQARNLIGSVLEYPITPDETREVDITQRNQESVVTEIRSVEIEWEGEQAYLVMLHDLTQRQVMEEQLRQSQKMDAVGKLAGGMSHEFNNLMMVVSGFAKMLSRKLDSENPLHHYAAEIQQAGNRAAELMQQLLAFSRRQVLQPQILDLNTVVTENVTMFRRFIGEDVELVTHLNPEPCGGHADRAQLEQVLVNLVMNARDAMPTGGTLTIATGSVILTEDDVRSLVDFTAGPYVQLSMSDTGCGMDPETQEQIFEPFFTTKDPGKGIGLGLSTAYGIIQQSNGSIQVESEIGRGTTFTIYLPEVIAAVEEISVPEQDEVPVPDAVDTLSGSETILLVEDEDDLRQLIRVILDAADYTVLEAANGQEALSICEEHHGPIHLLIADVVMPQMSGTTLAGHLAHTRPEMKVLYISGYTGADLQRYDKMTDNAPLLEKPFDPDELIRTIREMMDRDL